MKKVRKTISLLIIFALMVGAFPAAAFANDTVMTISSAENAHAGENINVSVDVTAGLNAAMIQFALKYDADVLELTSVQNGSLFAGIAQPTVNSQIAGQVYFCWDSISDTITQAGSLLTLNFTVKEGASGTTIISLNESEDIIFCDMNYDDVTPRIVLGEITVSGIEVTGITVYLTDSTIDIGKTTQATASVFPENASNKTVVWSITEGTEYAQIDSSTGEITGISCGNAVVRATACDGSGVFGEANISVSNKLAAGKCGKNLTWVLESDGTLTISGTGAMDSYADNSTVPWHPYCKSIKSVILTSGVTAIGSNAFYGCTALSAVSYPSRMLRDFMLDESSIASGNDPLLNAEWEYSIEKEFRCPAFLKQIEAEAFKDISAEQILLPECVINIGENAFSGNASLKYLIIPGTDTVPADSMLTDCPNVTVVCYAGSPAEKWCSEHGILSITKPLS